MMKKPCKFTTAWRWMGTLASLLMVLVLAPAVPRASTLFAMQPAPFSAPQTGPAAPTISNVDPKDAQTGQKVTITIHGQNFVPGAYVTFSNPAVHAISTHRNGHAKITVEVQVAPEAAPGPVTLYVTNPSGSSSGSFPLTVTSAAVSSGNRAAPHSGADTAAAASPSGAPIVTSVAPPSAGPGSNITLIVKGRNFARGARVAFSNPKITVSGTTVKSASELTAQVQIATDAATGSTGLFVVNPDQSEVEGNFQVGGAAINTAASAPASPNSTAATSKTKTPAAKTGGKAVSVNVFNLGDVIQVLKTKSKVQGTLTVDNGTLTYIENGVKVFSVPATAVQEIAPNVFFGLNTGTFHIFLSSGKHYNFAAASLNPTDTQKIEGQLQQALK